VALTNLVIHNGKLLTETGVIANGMVGVLDGVIDYAGDHDASRAAVATSVVDARGKYIAPGFIDLHIHGGAGSDFMDATPDAIRTVMRYHLQHGTTALGPTTATASLAEILTTLEALNDYRRTQDSGRALGTHIEGPYLTMSKRGCHLPEFVRPPDESEWSQIVERGPIASMTLAPELPGARELVEALARQGAIASAGHSEALYHEIEESIEWGVKHVTHLYCAMTDSMNNRWRGTPNPRSAGIVEAVYLARVTRNLRS
jgi:N-acetylglucosamine-6-phosphate deacetylase